MSAYDSRTPSGVSNFDNCCEKSKRSEVGCVNNTKILSGQTCDGPLNIVNVGVGSTLSGTLASTHGHVGSQAAEAVTFACVSNH